MLSINIYTGLVCVIYCQGLPSLTHTLATSPQVEHISEAFSVSHPAHRKPFYPITHLIRIVLMYSCSFYVEQNIDSEVHIILKVYKEWSESILQYCRSTRINVYWIVENLSTKSFVNKSQFVKEYVSRVLWLVGVVKMMQNQY